MLEQLNCSANVNFVSQEVIDKRATISEGLNVKQKVKQSLEGEDDPPHEQHDLIRNNLLRYRVFFNFFFFFENSTAKASMRSYRFKSSKQSVAVNLEQQIIVCYTKC
jgi:hypothetical protein